MSFTFIFFGEGGVLFFSFLLLEVIEAYYRSLKVEFIINSNPYKFITCRQQPLLHKFSNFLFYHVIIGLYNNILIEKKSSDWKTKRTDMDIKVILCILGMCFLACFSSSSFWKALVSSFIVCLALIFSEKNGYR